MATPRVIEKCRRGRPNEGKRVSWMTLGYGSFGDCLSSESGSMGRAMSRDFTPEEKICQDVTYAFKTSTRLLDSIDAQNLTGVDRQLKDDLNIVTDALASADTKCGMAGYMR